MPFPLRRRLVGIGTLSPKVEAAVVLVMLLRAEFEASAVFSKVSTPGAFAAWCVALAVVVVLPTGGAFSPLNARGELSRRLAAAAATALDALWGSADAAALCAASFAAAAAASLLALCCKFTLILCQEEEERMSNGDRCEETLVVVGPREWHDVRSMCPVDSKRRIVHADSRRVVSYARGVIPDKAERASNACFQRACFGLLLV